MYVCGLFLYTDYVIDDLRADIERITRERVEHERAAAALSAELREKIALALEAGVRPAELARWAGVTPQRMNAIIRPMR